MRNDELKQKAPPSYSSFRVPHSSFLFLSILVNSSLHTRSAARECRPCSDGFRFGGGEDEAEASASARLALDFDVAAVLCEHLPDDDEAEARAATARLRRVERVEDVRAHVLRHPRAGVREFDDDAGPVVVVAVRGRRGDAK